VGAKTTAANQFGAIFYGNAASSEGRNL